MVIVTVSCWARSSVVVASAVGIPCSKWFRGLYPVPWIQRLFRYNPGAMWKPHCNLTPFEHCKYLNQIIMGTTKFNQQPNPRYVSSDVELNKHTNKQAPLKSLGNMNLLGMINFGPGRWFSK